MSRIIDLSYDITNQMKVFPGDPAVSILCCQDYTDGYLVNEVTFGTHTGTHIDAPVHVIKGGKAVEEIPIGKFTGKAYVMDLTFIKPLEEITASHLECFSEKVKSIRAVIIKTGWGAHFGKDDFFTTFPGIGKEAVNWFYGHGIDLIGLECPSVNTEKHLEIHELLLSREIGIVESLANVDKLQSEYVQFFAVPLKLKGLDGSPVRAFAIED